MFGGRACGVTATAPCPVVAVRPVVALCVVVAVLATAGCGNNPERHDSPRDNAWSGLRPPHDASTNPSRRNDPLDGQPLLEELQVPGGSDQNTAGNGATNGSQRGPRAPMDAARAKTLIQVEPIGATPTPAATRVDPRDAALRDTDDNSALIDVTRRNKPEPAETRPDTSSMLEHSLRTLRKKLLRELEAYSDVDERTLDDAARLTKQNVEIRLLALHFLEGSTDVSHLTPLLDAIRSPHYPGEVHTLLRAALYHDVGSEDLRDRALAGIRSGKSTNPFDLVSVELCRSITPNGRRNRFSELVFRPDQSIYIYGELLHLSSSEVKDGFLSKVRVEVFLVRDGKVVEKRRLGDFTDVQQAPRETNFFTSRYRMPMLGVPDGDYELRVVATDLNMEPPTIVEQRVTIQIKK